VPAADILRLIVQAVTAWAGERGANDDVTLIVVRKLG